MSRKPLALVAPIVVSVALLLLLLVGLGGHLPTALAHPITVDASNADWTAAAPSPANLGHIGRNGSEEGEYVWKDASGDERTTFSSPDPHADLVEFRATADGTNLYFLALMNDIITATGDGAPMIQIAIDTDRQSGSGEDDFAGASETKVYTDAQWEILLTTRFGSNNNDVRVYTATATGSSWTPFYAGTAAVSNTAESIEVSVPWSALGLSGPPTLPLRLTVAVFRADTNDDAAEVSGASDALDCVTNYGDPGDTTSNTWAEVSDGRVDYYFDLFFETDGDIYPPLVVSEVLYNGPGSTEVEWVEIHNLSPITITLTNYKVGDEETVGGGEGMERLASGQIGPGGLVVVANNATYFTNTYGFFPDYEMTSNEAAVPDTADYNTWASGNVILSNSSDEVLLLDPSDTVIDAATWGSGSWAGVTPHASNEGDGESLERNPAYQDTNDCSVDFLIQSNPNPRQANPDLEIAKTGPALTLPGGSITYTITYSNTGVENAHNTTIADVLPNGTYYVTDTSGLPCPACSPGATGTLVWSASTITPNSQYSFTLTVLVSSSVPLGTALTNTVAITTTDAEVTTTNNTDQWTTSVSAVDLYVDKLGPERGIIGRQIAYTITVGNQGTLDAYNVLLTDTLPTSTTLVTQTNTCSATCPSCAPGATGVLTWNVGTVSSNSTCYVNLTVEVSTTVSGGTVLTNTAVAHTTTSGDNLGNNSDSCATTVYPLVPIHDIQYVADPASDDTSPYTNQTVWVEGVVVAGTDEIGSSNNNFIIEHPDGGPWSGLLVYNGGSFPDVVEGDYVLLLGEVTEYYGMTELSIRYAPHALEVISTSNPLPAPEVITTGAFVNAATAEQWEGVLIEFRGATVTDDSPSASHTTMVFDDGTGSTYGDNFGNYDGDLTYTPAVNDYFGFIRGIGWYSWGNYKLEPRYDADIDLDYPVTFVYHDAEDVVHSGEMVCLSGDWLTALVTMTPNADHSVFSITSVLTQTGNYQYAYVVFTDTVPTGPAHSQWLNTTSRSITVSQSFQQVDDYRNVVVGWADLQPPHTINIALGQNSGDIRGQVLISGVTDLQGEGRGIRAQVGYGTDPNPANWTWSPMSFDSQAGNKDQFAGVLTPTASGVYSYATRFDGNWGTGNPNAGWTYGDRDGTPFSLGQTGVITVSAPDLSGSSKEVTPTGDVEPGAPLTYTIHLVNGSGSTVVTASVTLTDTLPAEVTFVTATVGMTYHAGTHTVTWSGDVGPGASVDLVIQVHVSTVGALPPGVHTFHNTVQINDGYGAILTRQSADTTVTTHSLYLPMVARRYRP